MLLSLGWGTEDAREEGVEKKMQLLQIFNCH